MRVTKAGEYGVRCVLYLCTQDTHAVVPSKQIAEAMRIPEHFLTKIVQQLARMGIIAIEQGPKGGCQLLKTPKELSLLDVVEALMGEIFLNDCVMSPSSCFRNPSCAVHRVWCKAREQLRDSLRTATFDKLLEEESCLMPGHADEKVKEVLGRDSLGPNG